MDTDDILVVFCTAPDEAVAERLATGLVETGLVACVNVIPGVRSFYEWKGSLEKSDELQLIIKTRQRRFGELQTWIKSNHPYDVPELVALRAAEVNRPYAEWVLEQTK